jgi:hypothetical protein
MGASVAAAVIIRKERELVEHFAEAGAVSPSSARSSSDLGVHERFAWIRLVERGVIYADGRAAVAPEGGSSAAT